MVSNEESLYLYSTLTTFFTFDIFKRFLQKGDGGDEERGNGCWRLEMANTMINMLIQVLN